jgi:hypothetical protein
MAEHMGDKAVNGNAALAPFVSAVKLGNSFEESRDMRNRMIFASIAAFGLAACGGAQQDDGGAAGDSSISTEDVAAMANANAIRPDAGQYRVTMEVLEVDIPGAPEGAASMMRNMMGGQTHTYCLRQEDVEKGFEEMARQGQEGSCSFQRFDVDGGRFDAEMICKDNGQGSMTMTMQGQGTRTSSEVDMTMKGNLAGMGDSTIRMRAQHERIGDC